jgi:hypothetical protein
MDIANSFDRRWAELLDGDGAPARQGIDKGQGRSSSERGAALATTPVRDCSSKRCVPAIARLGHKPSNKAPAASCTKKAYRSTTIPPPQLKRTTSLIDFSTLAADGDRRNVSIDFRAQSIRPRTIQNTPACAN